ncbi:MAG TPA: hypothetical protein VGQ06_11680 [Gemmatimonadales bacterium]|jgi:hypothetical protein|nr:hypothetical protein [Gemmatimonadales bacterium]
MVYSGASLLSGLFAILMPATQGPTETVQAAFTALQHHDCPRLAALVDPGRLETFKQQQLAMLVSWAQKKDEIAAAERDGGEWSLASDDSVSAEAIAAVASIRVPTLTGSPTMAELATDSPSAFFIRLCSVVYGKGDRDDPVRDISGLQRQLIGQVLEGDTLAHVVYRRETRYVENEVLYSGLPGQPMVMSLRRPGQRWRLLLNDDIGWSPHFGILIPSRHRGDLGIGRIKRETSATPLPTLVVGMPPARRRPIEAVVAAFVAFERSDWDELSVLVHPERAVAFQREQIGSLVAWHQMAEVRAQTARDRVALMYSVNDSLSAEAIGPMADVKVPQFPGAPTIGELFADSPRAFFARWCAAAYRRDTSGAPSGVWSGKHRVILGEVIESDAVAHVLYRSGIPYGETWRVDRMPVWRWEDDWRLMLNEDIGSGLLMSALLEEP